MVSTGAIQSTLSILVAHCGGAQARSVRGVFHLRNPLIAVYASRLYRILYYQSSSPVFLLTDYFFDSMFLILRASTGCITAEMTIALTKITVVLYVCSIVSSILLLKREKMSLSSTVSLTGSSPLILYMATGRYTTSPRDPSF